MYPVAGHMASIIKTQRNLFFFFLIKFVLMVSKFCDRFGQVVSIKKY